MVLQQRVHVIIILELYAWRANICLDFLDIFTDVL